MTREQFLNGYIAAFNRRDLASVITFYREDVVLHLGAHRIKGRAGIAAFYASVFERVRETLSVSWLVIDAQGLAAEVETRFEALADWPDFIVGPLRRGDVIEITSFIHYRIAPCGLFSEIRTARAALPSSLED
jgi:hypothetical protein